MWYHVFVEIVEFGLLTTVVLLCQPMTPFGFRKKHPPAFEAQFPKGQKKYPVGMDVARIHPSTVKSPVPKAKSEELSVWMYGPPLKNPDPPPNRKTELLTVGDETPVHDFPLTSEKSESKCIRETTLAQYGSEAAGFTPPARIPGIIRPP